jgi:putative oxidoreductase
MPPVTALLLRNAVYLAPLARFLIAALFLLSGTTKLIAPAGAAALMSRYNMPLVPLFLWVTIAIEIIAALAILIGYRTRLAALVLFVWMVPVTLVFHAFWSVDAAQFVSQRTQFMKNLSIAGGLLLLVVNGAGAFSLDNRRRS